MTDKNTRWYRRLDGRWSLEEDKTRVTLIETGKSGLVTEVEMPWFTLPCGCCSEPVESERHLVTVKWDDDTETDEFAEDLMLEDK